MREHFVELKHLNSRFRCCRAGFYVILAGYPVSTELLLLSTIKYEPMLSVRSTQSMMSHVDGPSTLDMLGYTQMLAMFQP